MSQETHAGALDRLPPAGAARGAGAARASRSSDTYEANPGEVWEEDEFWIELSWRIDPDGSSGHPQALRMPLPPRREDHRSTSTTAGCSRTHVPGLPEAAGARRSDAARLHAQVRRVRDLRKGVAETYDRPLTPPSWWPPRRPTRSRGPLHERAGLAAHEHRPDTGRPCRRGSAGPHRRDDRRSHAVLASPLPRASWSSTPRRCATAAGRSTPSRTTSAATSIRAPSTARRTSLSCFRPSPADADPHAQRQRQVARTRSPIRNPTVDAHVSDAARLGVADRRPAPRVGPRSATSWTRSGSPRGSAPASSPARTTWAAGGWPKEQGASRIASALVELNESDGRVATPAAQGRRPLQVCRPRHRARLVDTTPGVHQNLTFPVQPDPMSGMHCWHQKVKVTRAEPQDRYGDVSRGHARVSRGLQALVGPDAPSEGRVAAASLDVAPLPPGHGGVPFCSLSPAGVSGGSE